MMLLQASFLLYRKLLSCKVKKRSARMRQGVSYFVYFAQIEKWIFVNENDGI